MNTKRLTSLTTVAILISFIITTVISVTSLNKVINDNAQDVTTILAARIYDTINSELSAPIMVARTMSSNSFLKEQMKNEENIPEDKMISNIAGYLKTVQENLGYNTAFVVSDATRKYYSINGLNKIISPEDGGHDVWYSIFLDSGKDYDFDVDNDEVNEGKWTIFVNSRLNDEEGNLLGVCGVGVVMTDIQDILKNFEQEYNVKVNLVNTDGLVQVDTDSVNIENAVIDDILPDAGEHGEYVYTKEKNGDYCVTKFVEDFGWYLVIRNDGSKGRQIFSDLIQKNILAFAGVLIVLLVIVKIILDRQKKKLEKSAITDSLTGLVNRTYFKYNIEENPQFAQKLYKSVAIFDIDKFKEINDGMGHLKGDEILKKVSEIASGAVGDRGQVIRWGGDEFLIMFKDGVDEAFNICEQIRKTAEETGEVTLSIGVGRLEGSVESSFKNIDNLLYKSKKGGRNMVVR